MYVSSHLLFLIVESTLRYLQPQCREIWNCNPVFVLYSVNVVDRVDSYQILPFLGVDPLCWWWNSNATSILLLSLYVHQYPLSFFTISHIAFDLFVALFILLSLNLTLVSLNYMTSFFLNLLHVSQFTLTCHTVQIGH